MFVEFIKAEVRLLPPETIDEFVALWKSHNAVDDDIKWQRAQICHAVARHPGQRAGETPIQMLCHTVHIRPETCSRHSKTWGVFPDKALDLIARGLVTATWLRFEHCYQAANFARLPKVALIEAFQMKWTPVELAGWLAQEKKHTIIGLDDAEVTDPDASAIDLRVCEKTASGTLREVPDAPKPSKTTIVRVPPRGLVEEVLWMQPAEAAVYRELVRRAVPRGTAATVPQILIAGLKELVFKKHLAVVCPRCGEDIGVPSTLTALPLTPERSDTLDARSGAANFTGGV
jgi:hypothetical protein